MPYSQFDNLNLRFLRGGSGRSSTGSRRSDFMVTETRAGGESVQTQGPQVSEWTGSGEGAASQVQQPRFSQWTGDTHESRVNGDENTGWAQWTGGSENIIFPQLPSTRDGNEKSNGEIFEMSNVS